MTSQVREVPVRELMDEGSHLWARSRGFGSLENLLKPVDRLCADDVPRVLKGVSQWGLKEIWLGKKISSHNRWEHSRGVLAVTARWLEHLTANGSEVLSTSFSKPLEKYKRAILLAALLHDFGHLPFAHLVGEVLENINWIPSEAAHGGLEAFVLQRRLESGVANWGQVAQELGVETKLVKELVHQMITGRIGVPWLRAILNSAIDADKIDYICRDSLFLQSNGDWSTISRLASEHWIEKFLSNQQVNHAGLLCLHGRSAVAAADLLRERIFLYDRFYLSPMIRVPDRMAFEIVQQFLIRSVVSDGFRGSLELSDIEDYDTRCRQKGGVDPQKVKCELVADLLVPLADQVATKDDREFDLLDYMWKQLDAYRRMDKDYQGFLKRCFALLGALRTGELKLVEVIQSSLVEEPLVFPRDYFSTARDILRPLQHTYFREALIDVIKLPRVLAVPRRWRFGPDSGSQDGVDYSVLVPEGSVSTWGPGSKARIPLTDQAVGELERPLGRAIVMMPHDADSARAKYIWDRVRSTLLESGVPLEVPENSNGETGV